MSEGPGYLHLNRGGEWPSLEAHDVVADPEGSLRLAAAATGGRETRGWFRLGPVDVQTPATPWFRLRADGEIVTSATHIQLFTFTSDAEGPPDVLPEADEPFADSRWAALPRNRLDALIPNAPSRLLWIGGLLRGDGTDSPVVHQMRVDYRRDTYLQYLPAVFGRPDQQREFLERLLSLHESVLGEVEQAIVDLPLLFDPECSPDDADSWLSWLCGWLAFERSESWSEASARRHLSEAFALSARRGTIDGLRRYLKLYAGVESRIEEAGSPHGYWLLGPASALGFGTVLAPGPLQGAVLGSSATLDESRLGQEDERPSLDDEDAHRFCVYVYRTPFTPRDALARAQAVVEREKPAHTSCRVQMVEARLRVGVQARVGIDAVVAEAPRVRVGRPLDEAVLSGPAPSAIPEEAQR